MSRSTSPRQHRPAWDSQNNSRSAQQCPAACSIKTSSQFAKAEPRHWPKPATEPPKDKLCKNSFMQLTLREHLSLLSPHQLTQLFRQAQIPASATKNFYACRTLLKRILTVTCKCWAFQQPKLSPPPKPIFDLQHE